MSVLTHRRIGSQWRDRTGFSPVSLATPQVVSNKPKIIAFGDSLSAGFVLTEKESYPYLLQE